ncbi:uncharacterized protein LOC114915564 [Cajanus cajan]|uniref:uncharacterized protein LOC114915564 n=1 Tax=Cajanus cajan TaxID=3821 RepID=UPI0010FB9E91|nr:uncharacterized protein LOC114915564 [Cajanus cajan]
MLKELEVVISMRVELGKGLRKMGIALSCRVLEGTSVGIVVSEFIGPFLFLSTLLLVLCTHVSCSTASATTCRLVYSSNMLLPHAFLQPLPAPSSGADHDFEPPLSPPEIPPVAADGGCDTTSLQHQFWREVVEMRAPPVLR